MKARGKDPHEKKVRKEVGALCARLRERGDPDSLAAVAVMEGHLEAFAGVVEAIQDLREKLKRAEKFNHDSNRLWNRVPLDIRLAAAHGPVANTQTRRAHP